MKNAHRISWHTPINSVSSCFFAGFSGYTDGCRTILSSTELQYYIARQYTKHMPKHKAGPGTGFYDPNRPPQREQFAISNSVSGIPFRHNRTFACFCARLFVSLTSSKILPLGNVQIKFDIALAYSYLCRPEPSGMPKRFDMQTVFPPKQGMSERSRRL